MGGRKPVKPLGIRAWPRDKYYIASQQVSLSPLLGLTGGVGGGEGWGDALPHPTHTAEHACALPPSLSCHSKESNGKKLT